MKKEAWPEGAGRDRGELIESNLSDGVGVWGLHLDDTYSQEPRVFF